MSERFDGFVVLAGMRTGSNFLEANLNAVDGVSCLGEVFNPHFVGYPNKNALLGFDQPAREANPLALLEAIRGVEGLAGFRFFFDHDKRILDTVLPDRRCAKIVLTRNPLESYVSLKIAKATGQWKLTNVSRRKQALGHFDKGEFADHVAESQAFQVHILNTLQRSGQTAFYLDYEDLQSLEVMNGLLEWLGVAGRLDKLDQSLKPQNPQSLSEKVSNPNEMERALSGADMFNLSRTPNFEPRRGPVASTYVAAAQAPLLYQPIKCGPEDEVLAWLAALDDVTVPDLRRQMSQKDLRQWKRRNRGHRCFTVLRHPVARAHHAFCTKILPTNGGSYLQIRDTLRRVFDVSVPKGEPDETYSRAAHRRAFVEFLAFLRANLSGQTALRIDGAWSSQSQVLQGFGEFIPPDFIWREDEWVAEAADLGRKMGLGDVSALESRPDTPYALAEIYDEDIEAEVRQIYQRDYMMFGFGPWG